MVQKALPIVVVGPVYFLDDPVGIIHFSAKRGIMAVNDVVGDIIMGTFGSFIAVVLLESPTSDDLRN